MSSRGTVGVIVRVSTIGGLGFSDQGGLIYTFFFNHLSCSSHPCSFVLCPRDIEAQLTVLPSGPKLVLKREKKVIAQFPTTTPNIEK